MLRVRTLILAHLGLGLACKKSPPVAVAEEAAAPLPTAATAATAALSASASASAPQPIATDPTPSASGSAKATPTFAISISAPLPPGRCRSQSDCPSYQACSPSGVKGELGYCRPMVVRGRPLAFGGRSHVAEGDVALAALEEHASIAAFARTICELMALGAPLWLIAETEEALADEIRHTAMTMARGGGGTMLGALPAATAPIARGIDEFYRDVFRGGAVGETRAALIAEQQWLETGDPFYETIAVDEAKHAALAMKTLRWLLEKDPSLARVHREEMARLEPSEERELLDQSG